MVRRADVDEAARLGRARLAHVSGKGQALADSISEWSASNPIQAKVHIAEDRLSWELRLTVEAPPLESWSLTFGDALHQLRSMLDNLLHFVAQAEGVGSRELRNVQFPIVTDRENWAGQEWHISMLPPRVQSAIRSVQPFNEGDGSPLGESLVLLSAFNNADKHRVILSRGMQAREIGHEFSVTFEDGGPSDVGPPRTNFNAEVSDGVIAIHHDTSPDRIKSVTGTGKYSAQIVVIDHAGKSYGITRVLAEMATLVSAVLNVILGAWAIDGMED